MDIKITDANLTPQDSTNLLAKQTQTNRFIQKCTKKKMVLCTKLTHLHCINIKHSTSFKVQPVHQLHCFHWCGFF